VVAETLLTITTKAKMKTSKIHLLSMSITDINNKLDWGNIKIFYVIENIRMLYNSLKFYLNNFNLKARTKNTTTSIAITA